MGRKKKLEILMSMGAWSSKISVCFAKPPNHQTKAPQTKPGTLTRAEPTCAEPKRTPLPRTGTNQTAKKCARPKNWFNGAE
jgi:hypothetical protein